MLNKESRKKLVYQLSNTYQSLFPDTDKCILSKRLLKLHILLGLLLLISFFVINNKYYRLFIIIGAILVLASNVMFNGCLMTMVELDLCPNAITITDIPLQILGVGINNKNRKIFTLITIPIIILLLILIFYYKYYK